MMDNSDKTDCAPKVEEKPDLINYKMIYQMRQAGLQMDTLNNLRNHHRAKADKAAEEEFAKIKAFIQKNLPVGAEFEVSNEACIAHGVLSHVWTWVGSVQKGYGKRACCFCGCRDSDDP